jgi:succinoglycan biosynthesis transport protein ExoP
MQTRLYTATATLFIDPDALDDRKAPGRDEQQSSSNVDSQVEIVISRNVATQVAHDLHLERDPEFAPSGGVRRWLATHEPFDWIAPEAWSKPDSPELFETKLVSNLLKKLDVARIGATWLIRVSAQTWTSSGSVSIANAFARDYVDELLAARRKAAKQAGAWMQDRIAELRKQSIEADIAKEKTRSMSSAAPPSLPGADDPTLVDRVSQQRIEMREAEASAETLAKAHDAFLQRYVQLIHEMTYPVSQARVVSAAAPPEAPSHPRAMLFYLAGSGLGLALGMAFALRRDEKDAADALQDCADLQHLGAVAVPEFRPARVAFRRRAAEDPPYGLLCYGVEHPWSACARTLQNVEMLMDINRCRTIGCVSLTRGEGTTTVAANLATALAGRGYWTLLIDWNFLNPSLTRLFMEPGDLAATLYAGHAEGQRGDGGAGFVIKPTTFGFHLASVSPQTDWIMRQELGSQKVAKAMAEMLGRYQFVVVDLPSLDAGAEAAVAATLLDQLLLVADFSRAIWKSQKSPMESAASASIQFMAYVSRMG